MPELPTAHDPIHRQATSSLEFAHTPDSLKFAVTYVFRYTDDNISYTPENERPVVRAICAAGHAYSTHVRGSSEQAQWEHITRMLDKLHASELESKHSDRDHVICQLQGMRTGDILPFFVRRRYAAIILTKRENSMLCEALDLSPHIEAVWTTEAPLYPGSSVEMSNAIFDDEGFQSELAAFLSHADVVDADYLLPSPADPRYINMVFDDILCCTGHPGDVSHIAEHPNNCIGRWSTINASFKDVQYRLPFQCIFIMEMIRLSVNRTLEDTSYKQFLLFFMCTLASDESTVCLSTDLLRKMSSRILHGVGKLGTSIHDWLCGPALKTHAYLQDILDARWRKLNTVTSPFRNPSQEELARDTTLSLQNSREYIRGALENAACKSARTLFHPNHCHRGTIKDFLSSDGAFFDTAYDANGDLTLFDVEQSIEQGIDDWLAHVTDIDGACMQLEILMDKYLTKTCSGMQMFVNPEDRSIKLLTGLELYVALDKLAVREVPILADYPPEIPVSVLERLFLRQTTSLHRLSCIYQYISARHSQSRPGWSVLSNEFTEDSLQVRYYDQSPRHQRLKAHIEEEAIRLDVGHMDMGYGVHEAKGKSSKSPLPASSLQAKVVVFELQCPACIRAWRSAAPRILRNFSRDVFSRGWLHGGEGYRLLAQVPALRSYFIQYHGPSLYFQIHFAFYPKGIQNHLTLGYVVQHPDTFYSEKEMGSLSTWPPEEKYCEDWNFLFNFNSLFDHTSVKMKRYMCHTHHTSNDVMAIQAECPAYLARDEFVAFTHLRSGGLLQWLNILQALRSRILNFRHHEVHFLLTHAVFQVGPLDRNTGTWAWHQELQDSSFCDIFLDEVVDLLLEAETGSIDASLMNTISLLLTHVLTSSPSEDVSGRVVSLLRGICRKMFDWVQELLHDLENGSAATGERRYLLLDMATSCRSTFDTDPATLDKHFASARDVDALLSCAMLIHALRADLPGTYSALLLERDRHLSFALEETLRNTILADPSDYGIDFAVRKIFTTYRPSACRWRQLQSPNERWITCRTEAIVDQSSYAVHINLVDGALRADGQPLGDLHDMIRNGSELGWIFRDGFCIAPSNLPGMDFAMHSAMSNEKAQVHFSLRENNLALQARGERTDEILQLIPSRILQNDLPPGIVNGHVHWLNLSTKIIEIRSVERPWEESAENWKIDCTSGEYHMYRGRELLVDMGSPTWAAASKCFECLANVIRSPGNKDLQSKPQDLLITALPTKSTTSLRLHVMLPPYGLSFFVNDMEELESCDFKDMVYDENRSVGALFGLENILVLRPKTHLSGTRIPEAFIHRRVLIPNGSPSGHGDQFRINTSQDRVDERPYHTYRVDSELGCFVGDGSFASTEFLARLHLATNHHRPDPFTNQTGAQAALCLLHPAGWRSVTDAISPEGQNVEGGARYSTSYVPTDPVPAVPAFRQRVFTLDHLICTRPAPDLPPRCALPHYGRRTPPDDVPTLDPLFSSLQATSSFQREYITHLNASTQHVCVGSRTAHTLIENNDIETLKAHFTECRVKYMDSLDILKRSLGPMTDPHEQASYQFGQWPPITADVLLRYLASTSPVNIPRHWKKCLMSLALLLLDVQRARRLLGFALDGQEEDFSKELENEGCDGWDPEQHPDWLLIQIQGNFIIRRAQIDTAMELMFPTSGENAVMQVNMGEGKSSVIIPVVAAALADGKQLVRVIVPKTLTAQMFKLLVTRLGGLTNRPIYYLPFSRSPKYDEDGKVISLQVDDLHKLMTRCMAERGILLAQPEQVVALKLMAVEEQMREGKLMAYLPTKPSRSLYERVTIALSLRSAERSSSLSPPPSSSSKVDCIQADRNNATNTAHVILDGASKWLNLQKWLDLHVRDILDESDEILHARFQLVYTIGFQQYMDGYPHRCTITQQILRLLKKHVHSLSRHAPSSIECECDSPGSFPHVRVLRPLDVGPRLISMIKEDVMSGKLPGFNFQHLSPLLYDAIQSFISDESVLRVPGTAKMVEEYAKGSDQSHLWGGLLLLRGLLTSNILLFALAERRWRVDYGLVPRPWLYWETDQMPTMLAVPYRAKDVPAPHTQFGHPDLTIIFTCLSYYYTGLSQEQLRRSFELLQDLDNFSTEYSRWIGEYDAETVPERLLKLGDINLRSSEQWDNVIFPLFFKNRSTIDFFLSRVVFPKELNEFPWKISGSSWDLAEKREKLITGFSGTNDSQWLLPMSIAQHDSDRQKGTNARVLAYLLRPENKSYMITHGGDKRWSTSAFLQLVAGQQPEIRVLLDVGSQILDLSNDEVASAWLKISRGTTGAVYFNEDDELTVLARNGTSMAISSSPLCQQLERCVVYLDHAHTRGTDLKLPVGSRAAVTLGPKVTKDALVQGCMRMRKLGRGHSVMFFAPPEIDRDIRVVASKTNAGAEVTTTDILCWAIHETWTEIQQRAPHWAKQGMDHRFRQEAWTRFCGDGLTAAQLSDAWLQPDGKSLADLYAPRETEDAPSDLAAVPGMQQRCKDLGVLSLSSAQMDEEQEREVKREREREREVELPPVAEPAQHFLHPDVVTFVKTGCLPPLHSGSAFVPVFSTLMRSSAVTRDADVWSPRILATADFCTTIKPESTQGTVDQYLRPVQWILTSRNHDRVLVLVSPFEVNALLPDIRTSEFVHLHLYAPRTAERMKPSDDLKLYTIPPLPSDWTPPWDLIDQLNVFAGQLYIRDYQSYLRLCRFLDVPTKGSSNEGRVRRNLFNIPGSFEEMEITFSGSPLPFVMALLAIRTRGRPFEHTHMGRILQGQVLTENDFCR